MGVVQDIWLILLLIVHMLNSQMNWDKSLILIGITFRECSNTTFDNSNGLVLSIQYYAAARTMNDPSANSKEWST